MPINQVVTTIHNFIIPLLIVSGIWRNPVSPNYPWPHQGPATGKLFLYCSQYENVFFAAVPVLGNNHLDRHQHATINTQMLLGMSCDFACKKMRAFWVGSNHHFMPPPTLPLIFSARTSLWLARSIASFGMLVVSPHHCCIFASSC